MDNHHEELNLDTSKTEGFVPPRHWIGPEELEASFWSNPKVQEKRGQEFYEKPLEYLDKLDQEGKTGLARRDFLTIMGASMAMASFACARRPVHKIIPYVVKPEEITPGVANWYASTCQECSAGCGILVKTREGRPIKIEGNPEHPLNRGAICSQGQASVLGLYDPDRLKAPILRNRVDGLQREISWSDADATLQKKLKEVASGGGRVRVLSGEIQSDATRRLIREFLSAFKAGVHVEYEPLALEDLTQAQLQSYGAAVVPHYQFDEANYVLSLGADFLGTWNSPVEHTQGWSKGRKLEGQVASRAKLSKVVCFESMMSLTGANSDERYPVRPGDELKVALAIACELIVNQKKSRFAGDSVVVGALSAYQPEKVAAELGLEGGVSTLRRLAEELWNARGKSLVVAGGISSQTKDSLALQVAANLLNSALENEGKTVDGTVSYSQMRSSFAAFTQLLAEMKAGQVDALIVYQSNPAYTLPESVLGLAEAFKKVPLVIMVADRFHETASYADYILPDHHALESWGDASPRKGVYTLQQPTLAPIHGTRGFQDTLLSWRKAGLVVSGLASRVQDWHEYLQSHWKETVYRESSAAGTFEQFWDGALRTGVIQVRSSQKASSRTFKTSSLSVLPKYTPVGKEEIYLALYAKVSMQDGRNANNAWLQEMPDPISSITWDNYLNVAPSTAKKLGVKEDDVVELKSGSVSVQLPVHVQPGLSSQVVCAAVGYGRRAVGKVGNQAGVDVFPLVQKEGEKLVYSGQPVTIKKTGKFYRLAATQWHTATENRPIINDITLAQFRKDPGAVAHVDPHLKLETVPSLWPAHEYKGYRWGMGIDLNSCTGCGACMVACQAENNVPVVGRDQVRVSRQMHWLRIDRYYSGTPENPDVIFQPMLCQHCENAPCETVCPVLATVHDDEGLNVQVYNRCVGTRYCQNNCPYKVRRFNFFDHWKSYEGPMNMVWNPDVTVRSRGIMEKCTFCVQRIRDAKEHAKDAGERVKDGAFQTACQQTCPSNAIVFGDLNDPESRVAKMAKTPQAFRVLEVLNTRPAISYTSKVRNKPEGSHKGSHVGHG